MLVSQHRKNSHLAVFGVPRAVMSLTLRKVLKRKNRHEHLIVLDYQGHASRVLSADNKGNLHKSKMLWVDLTNKRRPVNLFQISQSASFRAVMQAFLSRCFQPVGYEFSENEIEWLVDYAWRITGDGKLTLGALLRSLKNPQVVRLLSTQTVQAQQTDRFIGALEAILRFPGVWCLSEGNNYLDIPGVLRSGGTVWFEFPALQYQFIEHRIVSLMVETCVLNVLSQLDELTPGTSEKTQAGTILYAFPSNPPLCASDLAQRVLSNQEHIGVFSRSGNRYLAPLSDWSPKWTDSWVLGSDKPFQSTGDGTWFSEKEIMRLTELKSGQLWARSGWSGKAVTYRVKCEVESLNLAQQYRQQAAKNLRVTQVRQFTATVPGQRAQEKTYSQLYERLCDKEFLRTCWFNVNRSNKHSSGYDGVTIAQFADNLEEELDTLATDLRDRCYSTQPLRMISIPKPDGGNRAIKIPCVRDRVVQAGCLALLNPLFEPKFSHYSFAYRAGRNAHQAVNYVQSMIKTGRTWVASADIQRCFDSIDHDILLKLLSKVVADTEMLLLITRWLQTELVDFWSLKPADYGVPQGDILSPLLANIYLHPLDKFFDIHGYRYARYADDFIVMCESREEAESVMDATREFLGQWLGLTTKQEKTEICHATEGISFLGFELTDTGIRVKENRIAAVAKKVKQLVRIFGADDSSFDARSTAMRQINSLTMGVRNYYTAIESREVAAQMQILDLRVDNSASKLVPEYLRSDPAWLSRQRFNLSESAGMDEEVQLVAGAHLGYPERPKSFTPPPSLATNDSDTAKTRTTAVSQVSLNKNAEEDDQVSGNTDIYVERNRLYLNGSGQYVTYSGMNLIVKRRKTVLLDMPMRDLEMVFFQGHGLTISADLAQKLTERHIPVILSPSYGKPVSAIFPVHSKKSHLRKLQVLRASEPGIVTTGLDMLSAKMGNQASVLRYFARYRKRKGDGTYQSLVKAAADIRTLAHSAKCLDPMLADISSVAMGYEGRAAAIYWSAVATVVPPELEFPGRHTRFAKDRLNQALNYLYGMLYGEVWRAVIDVGLDPYFGIMHGSKRDQGSLVFDLIEEFRAAFVDRLLLGMVGRGFQAKVGKSGLLLKKPRRQLIQSFLRQWTKEVRWRTGKITPYQLLALQTRNLAATYLEGQKYKPFQYRW